MRTTVEVIVREVEPDRTITFEVIFGADVAIDSVTAVDTFKTLLSWAKGEE